MSPAALATWAVVQLACLGLAFAQVPLAAQSPPGDTIGPELLAAGQIGGAALFAGLLFPTAGTAAVVVASVWPALLLAGGLAARPAGDTCLCAAVVSAWLVALFLWRRLLPPGRPTPFLAAVAAGWAIGGALLDYLTTEFADAGDGPLPAFGRTSPILLATRLATGSPVAWGDVTPLVLVSLVAGMGLLAQLKAGIAGKRLI